MVKSRFLSRVALVGFLGAASFLAACNAADSGALVLINGALAQVSCPAVASSSNSIASNIIQITAPDQATATADTQLAAESANVFAELCPTLKGVTGLIIQASVNSALSGTPTTTITTASARHMNRLAMLRRANAKLPVFKVSDSCRVVSNSPYIYQCAVKS
jgi:hypothetical protein